MYLQDQLYRIITRPEITDISVGSSYQYKICLLPESVIYKAHFPEEPITPGACLVCIVKEITECLTKRSLQISSIRNLKFLIPVKPVSSIETEAELRNSYTVSIKITEIDDQSVKIQGTISNSDTTFCKLTLQLV